MPQKVTQGYVFGRSLVNIYFNDLLYLTESTKKLEHGSLLAIDWFQNKNATCWYLVINMKMFGLKLEMK